MNLVRAVHPLLAAVLSALVVVACGGGDGGAPTGEPDTANGEIPRPGHECGYDAECADRFDDLRACEAPRCVGGSCERVVLGTGRPCEAQGAGECEAGRCDGERADGCLVSTAPDGQACNPGGWNDCVGFTCRAGACAEVATATCDDGNPCTTDTCDPAEGCVYAPRGGACDDGNPCTTADACADGECIGAVTACECEVDADCLAFEDDDLCNSSLVCEGDECVPDPGTEVTCPQEDEPCTDLVCNPGTGACETAAVVDGAPCDDGDPCTEGDQCQDGACAPGGEDVCACAVDADCAQHDDGDACNGTWRCDEGGTCVEGDDAVDCSGQTPPPCNSLACDPASGLCEPTPVEDGTPCDDGEACTGDDQCQDGACVGGEPACEVDCADGLDEDADGATDCADLDDCALATPCVLPDAEVDCGNQVDDDEDGATDCDDPDCLAEPGCL